MVLCSLFCFFSYRSLEEAEFFTGTLKTFLPKLDSKVFNLCEPPKFPNVPQLNVFECLPNFNEKLDMAAATKETAIQGEINRTQVLGMLFQHIYIHHQEDDSETESVSISVHQNAGHPFLLWYE